MNVTNNRRVSDAHERQELWVWRMGTTLGRMDDEGPRQVF